MRFMVKAGIMGALMAILGAAASAEGLPPAATDAASIAARRFPQPVRVGDLIHRGVIEPRESRVLLGHVVEVVRRSSGEAAIVMSYGGTFGFGAREIAVPTGAVALLGEELEVLDYTPAQLSQFPTFRPTADDSIILRPDEVIRIGLTRPSH